MLKKSFANISLVSVGNIFNAGLGFLFIVVVAKTLSVEDFGKYALISSLLVSLAKIMDFGTNSIYVAKAINNDTRNELNTLLSAKAVLFAIGLPLSILTIFILGFNNPILVAVFIAGYIFYGINYTLFGLFQKEEKYLILVLLNSIPALIKGLFAALLFLNVLTLDLIGLFAVFALSIGPSVFLYKFLPKNLPIMHLKFSQALVSLKETFSPGLSQLLNEGFSATNNIIAKITSGFFDLGVFSLADKISNIFILVSISIFTVLLPRNAKRRKTEQGYDFGETVILGTCVLLLAFLATISAHFALPWFFGSKFSEAIPILDILIFASAISAIHLFMENYFFVENKTEYLAQISIFRLGMLILGAMLLTPTLAILGLAWAQLISSTATLLLVIYLIYTNTRRNIA